MKIPPEIASCCRITSPPRISRGASSAMYVGTIIDDAPTATPTTILNTTNRTSLGASAVATAPTEYTTASPTRPNRRLTASASRPPNTPPMIAPIRTAETAKLLAAGAQMPAWP